MKIMGLHEDDYMTRRPGTSMGDYGRFMDEQIAKANKWPDPPPIPPKKPMYRTFKNDKTKDRNTIVDPKPVKEFSLTWAFIGFIGCAGLAAIFIEPNWGIAILAGIVGAFLFSTYYKTIIILAIFAFLLWIFYNSN